MYCKNCGQPLGDNEKVCKNCGEDMSLGRQAFESAKDVFQSAEKQIDDAVNEFTGKKPSGEKERLQEDRSLLIYILLTVVTCGIYSWYFIYKMAKDINIACDGDGENTGGLVAFVLLSFFTCGIYSWVWHYKLGNRLASNASRYGLSFQENGTTVLLWLLFGSLLCGIGPYIAMYILINNANKICAAYNRENNL